MANTPTATASSERGWFKNILLNPFTGNGLFWVLYLAFFVVSMVTVSSAISSEYYKATYQGATNPILKHFLIYCIGAFCTFVGALFPARFLRNTVPPLSLLGQLVLLLLWVFFSHSANGTDRWILIFGITIQPAEFLRLHIILWGAHIAGADVQENPNKMGAYIFYLVTLCLFGFFFASSNLSMVIIYAVVFFLYCWMIHAPKRFLKWIAIGGGGLALLFALYILFAPESMLKGRATTWRARVHRMMEPKEAAGQATAKFDADDRFQEEQGRMAVASAGRGPGNSKMSNTLPLAYSDYLYTIIIEEYGLIGLLLVPGLYVAWMLLAYREARKQTDVYRSNLIKGFGILYPLQALVNMVVASGIITTGQPLPLLSFGGSSILAASIAMGLTIAASRVDRPKRRLHAAAPVEEVDYTELPDEEELEAETFADEEAEESSQHPTY